MTEDGKPGGRWRALFGRGKRRPVLSPGHDMRLLQSGEAFFPALEAAIDSAQKSVWIETYIFNDDRSGRRIAAALSRAAARGVEVRLVVDGFGTGAPRGEIAQRLGSAPVQIRQFRPVARWRITRRALRRLHRKLVLIDERTGFVGGINLIDDYVDPVRGRLEAPRLDFALELRGPLLEQQRTAMQSVWSKAQPLTLAGASSHEPLSAPETPATEAGRGSADLLFHSGVRAAFVERDNWRNRRTIERAYLRAIGAARSEVVIACAYFFPGARFRRALVEAVRRGVRVRLLLQGKIDHPIAHFGMLALYEDLLRAGIEIIEYQPSFLHAKLALADQWFTVGSSNIDPFSLLLAREANVIAVDASAAEEIRACIERAIEQGGRVVRWSHVLRRPWWLRAATLLAYLALRAGVAISGRGLRY